MGRMDGALAEGETAVEDETADRNPKAAAITAMTTTRLATRILRVRIRRVVARPRLPRAMPPSKAASCCEHVSGFRYADETGGL